jgi:hypothetical protein
MLHVFYTNQVKLAGTKTRNDTQLGTERVHVHVSCPSRAAPATVEAWKQSMLLPPWEEVYFGCQAIRTHHLYIYPLKGIFRPSHQDSLFYITFSRTHPSSISHTLY